MYINFILIFAAQIIFILNMEFIYLFTKLSQYCFSYGLIFSTIVALFVFLFLKSPAINKKIIYLLP